MKKDHWKVAQANRVAVIVDAEDYFRLAREAMAKSQRRIMLIGWDFDARTRLVHEKAGDGQPPTTVGDLIYWLVQTNPELGVYRLRWDLEAFKALFRETTAATVAKWMAHPRIQHKCKKDIIPLAAGMLASVTIAEPSAAQNGGIRYAAVTNGAYSIVAQVRAKSGK